MKKSNSMILLFLIAVLLTLFGSAAAQDAKTPAIMVKNVVPDKEVVLSARNFPADMVYTVSMSGPADPDIYTPVAKFNSDSGGNLSVTVPIPEKFRGLTEINLLLKDSNGARIMGGFVNSQTEEPAAEEPVEEPAAEEKPAEEPAAEEPAAEKPAEEPAAEEPVDEPAEEPAADKAAAEAPAAEEPVKETAEEPAAEEPAEEPVEEPAEEATETEVVTLVNPADKAREAAEKGAEDTVVNEPEVTEFAQPEAEAVNVPVLICDLSVIPGVHIDAVKRNESVTFTVKKFPADTTVSVSMGKYVESWRPAPMPQPRPYPVYDPCCPPAPKPGPKPGPHHGPEPRPFPHFDPDPDPDWDPKRPPAPRGETVVTFQGEEVGTFSTGDGGEQQLTFSIPASVQGMGTIAIWLKDQSPCGFYAYNYFYNNSTY